MGLMGGSLILGVAIGAPFGGYLTRWYGARAPLSGAGILFAVLAVAALLLREAPRYRDPVRLADIFEALRSRTKSVGKVGYAHRRFCNSHSIRFATINR